MYLPPTPASAVPSLVAGTLLAGQGFFGQREIVMPRKQWSAKRERQYGHIKDGLRARGKSDDEASEIAARTVNKVRAQSGEAETASSASLKDMSPSRRGGLRSHRGAGGRTYRQLYEEARSKGIPGRSQMNKAELQKTLAR